MKDADINPKVHYRVHNSPLLALNLSQMKLHHALALHFFNVQFNIILIYS